MKNSIFKKFTETKFSKISQKFQIFSVIVLTELAIPHLEKTKGNIVNISSIVANMAVTALRKHAQLTINCSGQLHRAMQPPKRRMRPGTRRWRCSVRRKVFASTLLGNFRMGEQFSR